MTFSDMVYRNYLAHYGVLGMKWGIRRYQNKDGSYTKEGKVRHNGSINKGKAAKEMKILKRWVADPDDFDKMSKQEQDEVVQVFNDIRTKSYDWMDSKAISKEQQKNTKRYEELQEKEWRTNKQLSKTEKAELGRLISQISGQALKDIGFEDTKEAREIAWKMIAWD